MVTPAEDVMGDQQSFTAAANLLSSGASDLYQIRQGALNQDASQPLESIRDASALCDSVMARVNVPFPRKQEILEILDVAKRMEEVFVCLHGENSLATIEQRIKTRVREAMEKSQRDYYLNEQLKAINKELGREEDPMRELDRILEELKKRDMPQKVKDKVESEIRKLRIMTPRQPSTPSYAATWTGSWICPGTASRTSISTSKRPAGSSTPTITASRNPRNASLSTSPCRSSPAASTAPSSALSARQALARPHSPSPWPWPPDATTCASPSAACAMRPKSGATAAPTSAPCPARSSSP